MTIQRIAPQQLPVRRTAAVTPARTVAVAQAPVRTADVPVVETESLKGKLTAWALPKVSRLLAKYPGLNEFAGHIAGPFVKKKFNAPSKPGQPTPPAPLQATTIEQARAIMANGFKPAAGKVIIGISGGGNETVHCFVVSDVKPDGKVTITQALAQYGPEQEAYKGLGGKIEKFLDKKLGNESREMLGVVEMDWSTYAKDYNRNTVVLMELDADPAKIESALKDLKQFVGKPYDHTMLGSDPATKSTEAGMYCTEVSSWFVNRLKPGTVKQSTVGGYPVYQVTDHMKATDVHNGPLKVLYNGQNRLDIKNLDPFPKA